MKICQILPVCLRSFVSNSFRIRSCPDPEWFFPDPAKSFGPGSSVADPNPDPDPPDPHVFGPPGSGSISQWYGSGSGSFLLSHAKIVRKTLIPTILWFFLTFYLNYVNVPSKSNKQKKCFKKIVFCWHLEGQWRKKQDPDPLVRGMDPRIRIHSEMSWIRNTARQDPDPQHFLCELWNKHPRKRKLRALHTYWYGSASRTFVPVLCLQSLYLKKTDGK